MSLPTLPTYYYLTHFCEMLSFVEATYASILDAAHTSFIAAFRGLSRDEQCVFVRMLNRRGRIFDTSMLRYAEIGDVDAAVQRLFAAGFVRRLAGDDYPLWLSVLRKDDLLAIAEACGCVDVKRSWQKSKILTHCLDQVPFQSASDNLATERFIVLSGAEHVSFLLYLYFGKTQDDLKSFALRDLGVVRVNEGVAFGSRFADANEARVCFYYHQLLDRLSVRVPAVFGAAAQALQDGPLDGGAYAAMLRDRACLEVGTFFEKSDANLTVRLYRLSASPECNERLVRLLHKAGQADEVQRLLERMIDDPGSDDEYLFASDFLARKYGGKRVGACTEVLRAGQTRSIDEMHRGSPEAGIASVFRRDGWTVHHAENVLWQTLFGLLFWDELFESGQLHSGFDRVPQCLRDKRFATLFAAEITAKLGVLAEGHALPLILRVIANRFGRLNGIFNWGAVDVDALSDLLSIADPVAVAAIVELMARDFAAVRDGFPDLMLVKDKTVRFVEIKGEGDVIRRNQLTRIRQMLKAGLHAEICRVEYSFDPAQDYVVVDIETTGGWAASDRVTEIGAVKMRNHEVVGEWHSLINPQRAIPGRIVQLTGITNEMVASAPLFSGIAADFANFMGDAVFVAHNVNFDYGFLAQEYARIEQRFRFPKFCTCAGMRRHFPGHASYGLYNLCRSFGIGLENHHRALCDARAASALLCLINRKRQHVSERAAA